MQPICFVAPVPIEERHLQRCVHDLYAQTGCEITEVIVTDGGNTDHTVAIVQRLQHTCLKLRLIANPRRSMSPWLLALGFAAIIMHMSYGLGVFDTLIDRARRRLVQRIGHAQVA
jgi:glycosyltransferase involved in cell wall biosynthesis